MTKFLHNQTYKSAVIFMVALLVLPISLSAGAKALRLFDSSNIENGLVVVNRNTFLFSSIEGQINALPDDTTAVVCPDDISIYTDLNSCDALITSGLSIEDPNNVITSLTWIMEGATTVQSPASGVNQINSSVFNEGTTIITYKGSTRYNNSINCSFTVTVSDNQVPKLIYGPGNTTVSNSSNECYALVRWTEPIVSDNCVAEDNIIIQSNHISGETFPVGVTEVEYRISDGINELIHRFTVTVKDDVAPTLTAPEPMTVVCGEEIEDAFTSWNQFQQAGGKVSDNCAINYNSFRYVSQTASGIRCPYTITRTYSIEDVNGNLSEVKRYIQVTGDEPEEIQEAQEKSGVILKSGMNVITSTGTGGDWNNGSTWVGGVVPQPTDDVVIASGATVTISGDQTCNNITINGTLEFSGSHTLNVTGSWTNDGNFNADSGTVQFSGSGSNFIGGGSTTVFKNFILDKGTVSDILNVNSDVVLDGAITFTSGLFQINSGTDVTCTGNSGFTVEADAGLYINGGSFTGGAFSVTFQGLFQIDSGTASFGGISGNRILTQSSGTFDVNGGTVNVAGRLEISGGSLDVAAGTINLNTIGQNSSTTATLSMTVTSDFNMVSGAINFLNSNGSGYYDVEILNTSGTKNILGGTFNFGDGSADTYRILTDIDMLGANTTTANNTELEITQNVSSNGTYTFDLSDGNGNIIPVTITISALSYGSNASIIVTTTDATHGNNASSTHFLSRYWTITLSDISGASYSVTAEYPQGDVNSGGQESEIAAGVWIGSLPWIKGNVANGGANTISISGLTSSVELTGITLDAPTVTAGATNTEICNGENINLTANGSGDPTLTYSWTGPNSYSSNNQNPTINNATTAASGTYTVTVTDGNGFTANDNVAITVNPTPTASAPANQTYCNGDATSSISLSGSPSGVVFDISGGSSIGLSNQTGVTSIPTFTADNSGSADVNATITVTPRANGCTGSPVTYNITVNPTPTVTNPGNQTLCSGDNTATISFSGSVSGTVYNWTNDNTSIGLAATGNGDISAFAVTNAGSTPEVASITVTPGYTNNGVTCTGSTETFTITVNPLPTATAGSNSPECEGETINLTASGGVSYSWTGPNGFTSGLQNPSISNVYSVHDGDYTVTVTDANGCEATATTSVVIYPKPTVKITIDDNSTICDGTEVTFTTTVTGAGTNPTFDWQINGISTGETGTSYTSSTLANTDVVRVIMTADPSHCSSVITSNSYVMTVNPLVTTSVSILESSNDICNGESIDVTATISEGGASPGIEWQSNTGSGWSTIAGETDVQLLSYTPVDGEQIRVVVTSDAACPANTTATSDAVTITVTDVVVPTVSIIANETTICPGDLVQFSVDSESNQGSNPSYQWKVNGVNVGTDLPTYSTSSLVDGDEVTLEMTSNARCASPTIATSNLISIVVNPGTPAIPGAITGNIAVCPNTTETYTIASVTDVTDYTWSVPGDWTIQSGQGTTTITVITGATGTNKNVSVTAGNSCGTSSPRTLNTTVGSESVDPTGISNPNNNTCEGTSKTLTVQGGSLGTGAQWVWYTGSCGGTQVGTGISITVNPSPGTYTYYVWAEGTCDTTACISVDVTVSPGAPAQPAAISGLTPVCPGESFTYFISPVDDADSYAWSVPGGWTITAGQGDTLITVTSGSAGQNGNISVTASNSCGTSTAQTMAVTVAPGEPATPGTIAGENDQCLNSSGLVYSIANVTNATNYSWTLPSGWTITNGSGTNSITVSTNGAAVSGTIEVTAENFCGESTASVLPVNVVSSEPADVGPINGQTAICPTVTAVYTVPDIGAVDYFWEVPSGWIIESGQGTPTLSVEIPMAGQSGDIIVTASNVCGPSDPDTLNVTVANDATVEAGPDQVVCEGSTWVYLAGQTGGAIDRHQEWDWVSVTPGGTFVDDRDLGTIYNFPSGFTTGDIYVAITSTESVGGCAYPTDTMKITVMPYPTASIASTDTVCNGEDAVVTISATSNTTVQYRIGLAVPTTIDIDGSGEATISLPALTTTTDFRLMNVRYTALTTCQMTTDYTVQVVVKDLAEVFAGDDQSVCISEPDVYLAGTITGDVLSGTWTGGSGTFTPNANTLDAVYSPTASEIAAGTLTLTLTSDDPAGPCGTSYDEVTITFDQAATVDAGSDQDICADGSATLAGSVGGAVASGVWTGGTGSFSPNANTLNASYTPTTSEISAGTVQLILSTDDPSGVCNLVSDTMVITIFPVATVDAGSAQTICATSEAYLSASVGGAATYGTWTGGNGSFAPNDTSLSVVYTPSADEISDGFVTLTLTTDDPNGPCNPVSDQVTITIEEAPTVNAGIDDRVCEGSTITLAGSIGGAASSATWSAVAGSFSDVNALNAVYTHENGYSGSIELVLTTDDPSGTCGAVSDTMILTIDTTINVAVGNDTMICSDATITLDGWVESGTGTWSTNGSGSFSNVNDVNAVYTPSSGDIFNEVVTLTFTTEDPGGDCGPASDNMILTIKEVIDITTEPKNTGACATDTAELFVEAVGDNLTYQWYHDDGTPVSNTAVINGAQSSILQFTNATSANMDGYYVVITSPNACDTAVSITATLNVDEEIIVTTPLVSDSVCEGEDVTFSIVAEPGGSLSYQWRKDGVDLVDGANVSGVNTSTLTLTNVTASEAGAYSVFLSGLAGYTCDDAQSAPGNLFVIPDATLSPSNQSETFCLDTPIDTIAYTFNGGVEDVLVTAGSLPPGLNTSFDATAKRFMIHGIPTVSGTYNFTLTTDGFCAPASATGTIIILDEFIAPVINGSQTICYNSAPTAFGMSSPPTGGSGVYSYQWQDSIPGSSWDTISGANADTYNSPDLIETTYFRLVVTDIGDPSCGGGVSNAIAPGVSNVIEVIPFDTVPPKFTVPDEYTLTADANCAANTNPVITGEPIIVNGDICSSDAFLKDHTTYYDHDTIPGSCGSSYSFTRTWVVTDEAGNVTEKDQTINLEDKSAPTLTAPVGFPISCDQDTTPAALGQATAVDNCDSDPLVTYYDVITPGFCAGEYSISRHWVATDACGNADTLIRSYDVTDNVDPVVTNTGDTIVQCVGDIPHPDPSVFEYYDFCGTASIELVDEIAHDLDTESGYCPYQVVRTWRVTDDCNNWVEFDQTISVQQDASCPVCSECVYNNTLYVADFRNQPYEDTTFYDVVKRDKCCGAENEPGAQNLFCASFKVRLDDGAVGVEILIDKVTPPGQDWQLDCEVIDGGSVVCLPSGEFHLFTFCKHAQSSQPQENDYTFRQVRGVIASGDIETREECDEVLSVTGEFSNPRWTSVYPGNTGDYDHLLSSTTDTIVYFNAEPGSPSHIQYAVCGDVTATLCATTTGGVICDTVDVYVRPAIEMDLNINPDLICEDFIPEVSPIISPAGAYDLEWYIGATPSGTPVSYGDSYTPPATGWYSVVAIDNTTGLDCNRDTFNFEMRYDLTGPTIKDVPPPLYLECNTSDYATLIGDWLAIPQAEYVDEYGDTVSTTVHNDYGSGSGPVTMICGDTVLVTFSAADQCSNDTLAYSYIYVTDTTSPEITPAQDSTIQCSTTDPNQDPGFLSWLANHGGATASDICDPDLVWSADTASTTWTGDPANNQRTVTFTVTDDCGNEDQTTATFTIVDDVPPSITCPANVETTIAQDSCSSNSFAIDSVFAIDDCSETTLEWTLSGATNGSGTGQVKGYPFNTGITVVHYVAYDAAGLADTCSFTVWVKHLDVPTANITCPDDSVWVAADEVLCEANVPLDAPLYTDPCNEIDSVWNNSPYRISSVDASGTYPIGTTEFKWFISDVSGNIDSTCTVKVVVGDVDPPQFSTCPDTIEGIIDETDCEITNFPLEEPTWTESCGADLSWIITPVTSATAPGSGIDFVPGSYSFSPGQTRITYVLTDVGGNTDTCSFIFWPKHQDFPIANITCPDDSTWMAADPLSCDADVTLGAPIITDPCNEIDSVWNNSPYSTSGADASGSYPIGTTEFKWFISDVSGNIDSSCVVKVVVADVDPPEFTNCPDTIEGIIDAADCEITNFPLEEPTWNEICGAELTYIITPVTSATAPGTGSGLVPSSYAFSPGQTRITYVLTDSGNNTDTCSFIFWPKHQDFPTSNITCPADSVWAIAGADCYANVQLDTVIWTDPCNEIDSIWNNSPYRTSFSDASGTYPIGATDFAWYILDVSGNMDSCNVTVIVEDDTAPYFTSCPTDTLEDIINDADCDMTNFTLVNPTYEVGCGADLRWILSGATNNSGTGLIDPSVVAFNVGITTITYILEDESNNADTCIYWAWAKRANFPTASITCPPASVSVPADPATCDAFVTLDTVVWTDPCNEIDSIWNNSPHRTSYDDASGTYPIGTTNFSWFILDVSGNIYNCDVAVTVTDTTSPNITGVTDIIECPDFVVVAGDTQLDLDTLLITDDCADDCSLGEYTIRWRIDLADGSSIPSGSGTYNTGLLSEYGSDILFPADSVTYTTLDHTVTYWVVDCSGNVSEPEIRTVSVYPPPTAIAPADTLSYCYADTVPAITLEGYPAGDVAFDVSGGSSLGIPDMTGVTEIPSFWATSTGTATISITPRANGCVGSPVTFVLIITEPVTVSVSPVFQTICSGETTNIHLMSSNPGAIFSYEVTSVSPAGSVIGAIDSTGEYIRQTLINTTQSPVTVTYTVTATANGCTSPGTANATVTINPTPELIITDPDTVCEPETVDLTTAEITAGSASGLTFTYWEDAGGSVSLSNPSAINQSGTYYIRANSGAGCEAFDSVRVVINPLPELTSELNPSGICSNEWFEYVPESTIPGTEFEWTRAEVPGISNPAESGNDSIREFLVNTTLNPIAVTYQYTLIANGCPNIQEVVVVVTPTPNLTSTQTPPSICSGTTFSYTPTSDVSGTTFPWTRAAVPGISNPAASGVGNPNEVLINTTSSPIGVTYEYTLTSNDCGNPVTFPVYVIVVPSPNVTAWANPVEICPGESIDLFSTSDVVSTKDPVILTEDFNSASVGSTSGPNGWTTTNNSWGGDPSDAAWTIRQDNYNYGRTFSSNDDSQFYLSNSDAQGRRSQTRTTLVSPMMNTEGYTNLQLEFYHYYRSYSSRAYVDVSTDGSNWTTVQTYYGSDGSSTSFSHETISLNGYVGSSSFYVRFRYEADWGYYWAIDNVEISGTPVAAANVTWTSIPAGFTSTEANPTNVYPTQTTTYIAEYTDPDTNCPGYDSVTVVVRDLPDARIDADYCIIPDEIQLTASGGTSYLWSTGETTQSITVDIVDIYSVLVTDAFGCQNTAYTSVSEEQVIDGTFTNFNGAAPSFYSQYNYHPDNPGSNTELVDDSGFNGYSVGTDGQDFHYDFWGFDHTRNTTGDRNYMIINGHEDIVIWQQEVTVFPNTDYYFSAWARSLNDYGPFARLQFEVNDTLVGTIANLGAGPGNASQAANSDDYWVHFYSNPLWNSGTTSGSIVIRIVNLESALGGNDFGLDDISFGTLDPLPSVVEAISNSPVCEGDSVHLSMTVTNGKEPFTYNWTGPNGFTATGQNVSIPNTDPSYSGDYIAVVTDGYGCGPTYDTITVVVEETPTVDAGPDQELCAYEREVTLAGSIGGAATSATWTGGTGTFSDSTALNAIYTISDADTTAGIVTLVLTTDDPAGECGPVTDTMQIIIHPVVNAVLDTAIDPTCPGDADGEITVHGENGTEPYTYSWNTVPEQTTATANGLPAGTYTVTVTDAFGCWDTVSVTLTDPETLVVDSVTFTEPLCYNGEDGTATVHISSGTNPTIVWSNGDTTLTADSLSAGLYTVTVYAENWCSSVTIPIAVTQPDPPTVDCPEDIVVFADFGADSASNVALEAPVYNNDCPLETQTWTLSGVTIDSSAQNVIDTLWVHDFNIGVTTVTYTFTDIVGNVSVCDFTVTVLAAPVIECPPDTTLYLDGTEGQCAATYDPGVPDLIEGVPPIEWTYTIEYADGTTVGPVTYTKDEPDQYPDPLGELDFPLGVTTIHWRAQNTAGFDTCSHWIEVIDTIPPTLTADPYENCVDPLHWAVYNEANPNPVYNHVDPLVEKFPVDYRTLFAGDEFLDLTSLEDNCCDSTDMTIQWRIEFSDTPDPVTGAAVSHPDITGTGQPSEYEVGGIPTDIYLWGDGVIFTTVTHQIFYWVEDCNGNTSEEIRAEITITPRPEVKKEGY